MKSGHQRPKGPLYDSKRTEINLRFGGCTPRRSTIQGVVQFPSGRGGRISSPLVEFALYVTGDEFVSQRPSAHPALVVICPNERYHFLIWTRHLWSGGPTRRHSPCSRAPNWVGNGPVGLIIRGVRIRGVRSALESGRARKRARIRSGCAFNPIFVTLPVTASGHPGNLG